MISSRINIFIFLFTAIMINFSCRKGDVVNHSQSLPTVLIYMAANNNLAEDALRSVNKMKVGASKIKGNLLVLIKTDPQSSYLLKINSNQKIDTLKTYLDGNTSDPSFLSMIVSDSKKLCPAKSFGFVFWSHATSWAPPSDYNVKLKSVGYDFGKEMDIKDFKRVLPDDLEFILFDACSMASLEAVYELKEKAKYILASPSEVLSSSYPYQNILPLLFGGENDLKKVGKGFIDYYESFQGELSSATVSLINTQELAKLAALTKELIDKKSPNRNFDRSMLQKLNFDLNTQNPNAYDFLDFLSRVYTEEEYSPIKKQLEKVILYKGHTATFLGEPVKSFCGVSIYLPIAKDPLTDYYSTLNWSSASNWIKLFSIE